MKNIKNEFTKETILAEILKYPETNKVLSKYKLPCLHCPMAVYETNKLKIGEVVKMYGINLKNLLKELNKNGLKKT